MGSYDVQVLYKQPSESRVYEFDFAANLAVGETISSVTSVTFTPVGLTVGGSSIAGTRVQVRISSGTTGQRYKGTAVIVTSLGNTLEGDGQLEIFNR